MDKHCQPWDVQLHQFIHCHSQRHPGAWNNPITSIYAPPSQKTCQTPRRY